MDWIRAGNAPLPVGSRVENGTLYIDNVQSDYAGEYQCIGLNNQGQLLFTAKANLAVVGKEWFLIDFPNTVLGYFII